jgi:hypothetical protein
MKLGIMFLSLLCLAGIGAGQQGERDRLAPPQGSPAKRLASFTFDMQTGKLIWMVQSGVSQGDKFVPSSEEHYEISPDDAVMTFNGQKRGFTQQEATWLKSVLHVLSVYCAESTIWWDQGQGTPLDGQGKPLSPPSKPSPNSSPDDDQDLAPHKIQMPFPHPAPGSVRLIAMRFVH